MKNCYCPFHSKDAQGCPTPSHGHRQSSPIISNRRQALYGDPPLIDHEFSSSFHLFLIDSSKSPLLPYLIKTLYRRVASYKDFEDLKRDVRLLLAPVTLGVTTISWVSGKLEPKMIGLPTSPSSTAVQDRVLQAAAKHESQPTDEEIQGQASDSSDEGNEKLDLSEA